MFSQWHATSFTLNGNDFVTAEQWMMYAKARLFADDGAAQSILASPDPSAQKRLGQRVTNFDQVTWDQHKIEIVYRGSLAKFSQNPGAQRQLLATGDVHLVEANPRDWIWGCGLSADHPDIGNPSAWLGTNLLGRILTAVRCELAA